MYSMSSSVFVFFMKIDINITSINLSINIAQTTIRTIIKDNASCIYISALFHVINVN